MKRHESIHPYYWAAEFVSLHTEISNLSLSYYKYVPQKISDERLIFNVSRAQFLSQDFLDSVKLSCRSDMELAFHSNVRLRSGEQRHIPMMDMATTAPAQLDKLREFLGESEFEAISWFKSGRSFHGYGATLLSDLDWVKMMGILLLVNQKNLKPIVDPRWIGHRLIAGYSALRWTKNTAHYVGSPVMLESKGQLPTKSRKLS